MYSTLLVLKIQDMKSDVDTYCVFISRKTSLIVDLVIVVKRKLIQPQDLTTLNIKNKDNIY